MKTYYRRATLTNVVIDDVRGTVTGINDFGAKVVMTTKQFSELYSEDEVFRGLYV